MITTGELMDIKLRLLLAADAANQIATSPDPVLYDQEQYAAVFAALVALKPDIQRVLAELDVLRGMFASSVSLFMEGQANGVPERRGDVEAVPDASAGEGSASERQDAEGAGSGVPSGGPARKRARRSKPRRNRKSDGGVEVEVGRHDGEGQVDSSQDG